MTFYQFVDASLDNNFLEFQDNVLLQKPFFLFVTAMEWCGHCKAIEDPLQKYIATTGRTVAVVQIDEAAYNHLRNYHSDHVLSRLLQNVNGFPSIMWVDAKANNNENLNIHEFDEQRSVSGFSAFEKKHMPKKISQSKAKKQQPKKPVNKNNKKSTTTTTTKPKKPTKITTTKSKKVVL